MICEFLGWPIQLVLLVFLSVCPDNFLMWDRLMRAGSKKVRKGESYCTAYRRSIIVNRLSSIGYCQSIVARVVVRSAPLKLAAGVFSAYTCVLLRRLTRCIKNLLKQLSRHTRRTTRATQNWHNTAAVVLLLYLYVLLLRTAGKASIVTMLSATTTQVTRQMARHRGAFIRACCAVLRRINHTVVPCHHNTYYHRRRAVLPKIMIATTATVVVVVAGRARHLNRVPQPAIIVYGRTCGGRRRQGTHRRNRGHMHYYAMPPLTNKLFKFHHQNKQRVWLVDWIEAPIRGSLALRVCTPQEQAGKEKARGGLGNNTITR